MPKNRRLGRGQQMIKVQKNVGGSTKVGKTKREEEMRNHGINGGDSTRRWEKKKKGNFGISL